MTELRKELTLYGLTMVAIGSCIGSGIFLTPSQIAGYLPQPLLVLVVWAVGGIITLTGALTFAELGAMYPQAGGVYQYLKVAYGDLFGFLYGWAYLVVITSGAIAALCIACTTYIAYIIPMSQQGMTLVAILLLLIVTVVNVVRVKAGEMFSNIFTGLKLLGIAGIILVGIFMGKASHLSVSAIQTGQSSGLINTFGLALIGVLWSYGGWQHASFVAGEAKDAKRTVPRAMVLGGLVVAVVYLLANVAFMFLLPIGDISKSASLAADAIQTVLPFGGIIIAVIIAISTFGTAGIYTLSAPRIYYAMAKDKIFFSKLADVHPKFRTPVNAIIVQSTWAVVLLLFWGTFEDVITYVVFTDWIFFCLTAIAIFILRKKAGDVHRPYKTFGYPITPLIFITITFFFVVNTLVERPLQAWAGLILMAIGTGLFYFFKQRRERAA